LPRPRKTLDLRKVKSDNELLNQVAQAFGSKSDRELAKRLGIPQSTMSKVRKHEAELAWNNRVILMDKLGFAAVRRAINSVLPQALADRVTELTNYSFEAIAQNCVTRELEHEDANLINFLDSYPELAENPVFNRHANLSDHDKDAIRAGAILSREQRIKLLEAFYLTNPEFWSFDWSNLSELIESSSVLLDELERLAYPLDANAAINAALIAVLEKQFGGTNALATLIELSPSQISQIKKGDANITLRTRLKILTEVEKALGNGDILNFSILDDLANKPELIIKKLQAQ
jgi:plasmid maintenance system antidote protein VapI